MDSRPKAPVSLVIVAVLFVLGGLSSLLEMVAAFGMGRISLNFGVLGMFIGPGLLRYSRGWRTCALVFIWIAMAGVPLIALLMLAVGGPLDFRVFGRKIGQLPLIYGLAVAGFAFGLALWQYYVLTRADIRRLFQLRREISLVPTCHHCGYNLTGNESGVCPECGTAMESVRTSDGDITG